MKTRKRSIEKINFVFTSIKLHQNVKERQDGKGFGSNLLTYFVKLIRRQDGRLVYYRTQSPMHLCNAAIMADGKVLVEFGEIQRQYLQMAPLKGFIWKVSIISLLCYSLISLVLSIFDVFSRKSKKQTWTLKHRKNYSTWLVRFTMQV